MKKLIILLFIVPCVILLSTSCKDDDPSPAEALIGSWQFATYTASECTDPDDNETDTCTSDCEVVTFSADMLTFDDDDPEPYTVSGTKLTIGAGADVDVFEFSISGNTLTLIQNDDGCKEVNTLIKV